MGQVTRSFRVKHIISMYLARERCTRVLQGPKHVTNSRGRSYLLLNMAQNFLDTHGSPGRLLYPEGPVQANIAMNRTSRNRASCLMVQPAGVSKYNACLPWSSQSGRMRRGGFRKCCRKRVGGIVQHAFCIGLQGHYLTFLRMKYSSDNLGESVVGVVHRRDVTQISEQRSAVM